MELIEDHTGDARQFRVGQDHAGEDALRDHLDARSGRNAGLHAHAETHGFADILAQRSRHTLGGGAGGQTARFQDDDPAVAAPGLAQQLQRHDRRLSGTRRRDQNSGVTDPQGRLQRGQGLVDRQHPWPSTCKQSGSPVLGA